MGRQVMSWAIIIIFTCLLIPWLILLYLLLLLIHYKLHTTSKGTVTRHGRRSRQIIITWTSSPRIQSRGHVFFCSVVGMINRSSDKQDGREASHLEELGREWGMNCWLCWLVSGTTSRRGTFRCCCGSFCGHYCHRSCPGLFLILLLLMMMKIEPRVDIRYTPPPSKWIINSEDTRSSGPIHSACSPASQFNAKEERYSG